jgi:hypothetical protein
MMWTVVLLVSEARFLLATVSAVQQWHHKLYTMLFSSAKVRCIGGMFVALMAVV